MSRIGFIINHDDTDEERGEGSKLNYGFKETQKMWKKKYGEVYEKEGAMYQGEISPEFVEGRGKGKSSPISAFSILLMLFSAVGVLFLLFWSLSPSYLIYEDYFGVIDKSGRRLSSLEFEVNDLTASVYSSNPSPNNIQINMLVTSGELTYLYKSIDDPKNKLNADISTVSVTNATGHDLEFEIFNKKSYNYVKVFTGEENIGNCSSCTPTF